MTLYMANLATSHQQLSRKVRYCQRRASSSDVDHDYDDDDEHKLDSFAHLKTVFTLMNMHLYYIGTLYYMYLHDLRKSTSGTFTAVK